MARGSFKQSSHFDVAALRYRWAMTSNATTDPSFCPDCPPRARDQAAAASRPAIVQLSLAMGGFAIGTTEFAAMSLLPYFAAALGVDEPAAGHAISAYALGVVVGAPAITVLAARMARRTLLIALMAVFALANVASAFAPNYETMLVFRFLSGLPHGAYFGVAALVAASLVAPNRRAQAVARMMLGLTVATILGVPLASFIGQTIGWRFGFALVGVLALVTVVLIVIHVPRDAPRRAASPLSELGALANGEVWLTLAIGAIGFGGMFAVYTFLASTLMQVTGAEPVAIPVVFAVFGVGMTAGTLVAAWAADRLLMPSVALILLWSMGALVLYTFVTHDIWLVALAVFLIGSGGGLAIMLQTRLMDVAGEAQTLAASLNHSAFNFANALGPWLAGLAIKAGWGLPATGWVGAALASGGLLIWAVAMIDDRRRRAAD